MVYLHLAEGFEEIEAVTIADVLRRAEIDVKFVSVTDSLEVVGAHGIEVKADLLYGDADYGSCEMIVLPGGMPGTKNLGEHGGLVTRIKAFNEEGKWLAAICAAPMVFARAGILSGKPATIFQGMQDELLDAEFKDVPVVVSDNIITSRGPGTAFDFSLKLVEVLHDVALARDLKDQMMVR